MTSRLTAAVLALEAFLVFFATLAAVRTVDLPSGVVWGVGLGLSVICLLAAGLVRRPGGLVVGSVVQGLLLLTGIWVPAMLVMGVVFTALWIWFLRLGRRIDRDRAAWAATDGSAPAPGTRADGG